MSTLSDKVLDHLRTVVDRPDLTGTRYELRDEIGRGGMGVVYEAWDTNLGRAVALKVVDSGAAPESAILAQLEHPGIVPVYDAGTLPDGRAYYAMRLVSGQRLDQFIEAGPSLAARLRVFLRICEAVEFAHSRGIVHRDLKPRNIMTGRFGEVFVMDWGIAHETSTPSAPQPAGTHRYMAPEHATEPGPPADIFALGRVLEDLVRDRQSKPLLAIAARASARNPAHRFPTASGLASDVIRYLDGLPVTAYRENVFERTARFAGRNRVLLLLIAAYMAVRILLFLIHP